MPNHVTNDITITGSIEAIRAFKEAHIVPDKDRAASNDGNKHLDFNTVIPMPECLSGIEESSHVGYAAWAISGGRCGNDPTRHPWAKEKGITDHKTTLAWLRTTDPEAVNQGLKYVKAVLECGHGSWYSWCIDNWGTKWNSYSFEVLEPLTLSVPGAGLEGRYTIRFDTAWSVPERVIEALSSKYPTLRFSVYSLDEGCMFAFEADYVAGAIVKGPGTRNCTPEEKGESEEAGENE